MMNSEIKARIEGQLAANPVMLYMKGSPEQPRCGFSNKAVQVLKACGCERFGYFDVLEDNEIREGIKEYADWPTIPQLWVNKEFIGGSDIMIEMYENDELQPILAKVSPDTEGNAGI